MASKAHPDGLMGATQIVVASGGLVSVEDQLQCAIDADIYGTAYLERYNDGTFHRVDPEDLGHFRLDVGVPFYSPPGSIGLEYEKHDA